MCKAAIRAALITFGLSRVVLEDLVDGICERAFRVLLHALERVLVEVDVLLAELFERLRKVLCVR